MRGAGVPDAGQSIGMISLGLPFLFSRFQVGRDSCLTTKLIRFPLLSLHLHPIRLDILAS